MACFHIPSQANGVSYLLVSKHPRSMSSRLWGRTGGQSLLSNDKYDLMMGVHNWNEGIFELEFLDLIGLG